MDDKTKVEAYAIMYAALHGLRSNVITFSEFMQTIGSLREGLERKQQQAEILLSG